jgi:molecular chaperone GrpE
MKTVEESTTEVEAEAPANSDAGEEDPQRGEGSAGDPEAEAPAAPPYGSPLGEALLSLQREQQETRERLLRVAADFDNFKKRSKRDAREGAQRAENGIVLEFLPILDNLQRALLHAEARPEELLAGVRMVEKQFLSTLERYDIRPVDAKERPFDPELHEAIQQVPSEVAAGTVCEELQVGYVRGERLVRPSLVVVSSGPAKTPAGEEGETTTGKEEGLPGGGGPQGSGER